MSTDKFTADGYRLGVGMVIANANKQLFSACRQDQQQAWQFPQGGIKEGETELAAMYRELAEEVGLQSDQVRLIAKTRHHLSYDVPLSVQSPHLPPIPGQVQRWFLLQLLVADDCINLDAAATPEFCAWRWVDYWQPVDEIVAFKRPLYQSVLTEFSDQL